MKGEEGLDASALEIGVRIRAGELSSLEVTEASLARIERLEGRLHAYLTVDAEGARLAARRADAEIRRGLRRSPLHGVPIAVKDLCDTSGLRTTAGLRVLWDRVPGEDAALVARLRAAGTVLLGKLTMTEGALGLHHPSIPPAVNPWDASRWTGVSSTGSGVATAARLCFAAIGSDTGGSIRVPASCCGLVGLKPTYGRVPLHGVFPLAPSLDHVGPMTRTVGDAAAMLGVIAGHDSRDPTSLAAAVPPYLDLLENGIAGVRIGCIDDPQATVTPAVATALRDGTAVLREAGAELRTVRLPSLEPALAAWNTIASVEAHLAYRARWPAGRDGLGPALAAFLEAGSRISDADRARADAQRRHFAGGLAQLLTEVDLLLAPTLAIPVPAREPDWIREEGIFERILRFTAPFNLSGHPALSLPAGLADDGLPVGIQLVARPLEEGLLLRAARVLEAAREALLPMAGPRGLGSAPSSRGSLRAGF